MSTYHPWSELVGIYNAELLLPPETEVLVSVEVVGRIKILLDREEK